MKRENGYKAEEKENSSFEIKKGRSRLWFYGTVKGMVHWPEGDRNIPVLVEKNDEEIILYFKGYKFEDRRFISEIDFYDLQKGMIVTLSEVLMRKNPAFPESPYPWIGVCEVQEVLR